MELNCKVVDPIPLELLSPAKDLATALVALSAGADAVYVGAPKFGARQNASFPLEDLKTLSYEAHEQGAKVYVALNTILYEEELQEAEKMIHEIYASGVDALIVQDMGIFQLDLPPLPIHASTQCHNDTLSKIKRLHRWGVDQVVLPREMSIEDMRRIGKGCPKVKYEAFIHGALCVSFSGRCYLSYHLTGRSANRGACAQSCRLPYDLVDSCGTILISQQHLLSLKDLNRSEILGDMIEAGISSFKIEGRLKNIAYVRNTTAYYRKELDRIIASSCGKYIRASWGKNKLSFTPDLEKTFQRGYTPFNHSIGSPTHREVINPITPKSMGEYMGTIVRSRGRFLEMELSKDWIAGDGLIVLHRSGKSVTIEGALVNRVANTSLELSKPLLVEKGDRVYRNNNLAFEKQLEHPHSSQREIDVDMRLSYESDTITLRIDIVGRDIHSEVSVPYAYQKAQKIDHTKIEQTISKLGDTYYRSRNIQIQIGDAFLPSSVLSQLKRDAIEQLKQASDALFRSTRKEQGLRLMALRKEATQKKEVIALDDQEMVLSQEYNVVNSCARKTYREMGFEQIASGVELQVKTEATLPLMTTHHCLLNYLGYCTRKKLTPPFKFPLYLRLKQEQEYKLLRLSFDCSRCMMQIFSQD